MTERLTPEQLLAAIAPKTDQLNADDLVCGPITVTITDVTRGTKEQPIVIAIEGHKPYKPCITMGRVLVEVWTDDPDKWIGQRMTLYRDPEAMFGGHKVGGIRISHVSGLETARSFIVTISRGNRKPVTIQPLQSMTPEEHAFVAAVSNDFATAATLNELQEHGKLLASKSKPVQDALRPIFAQRLRELKIEETEPNKHEENET